MNPASLLKKYGIRPRRRLGQNFLVSERALRQIIEAAELTSRDSVLEIGPGLGVLTEELVGLARCIVAVELDEALVRVLRERLGERANLTIHQGDVLELSHVELVRRCCGDAESYKAVANLPYYITSRVLRKLLEEEPRPKLIVVMVQREVAERAVASPPDMSLLAVSVQYYSVPRVVGIVRRGAFVPPPEVDSAILQLRTRAAPPFPDVPTEAYFRVVAAGFGQKRKRLANSLSANLGIEKSVVSSALDRSGINQQARAEQLSLEDWARICRELASG